MGSKSRGNWNINWCNETKCKNRDKLCKVCIRKDKKK